MTVRTLKMLYLTRQERIVLITLCCIFLTGTMLHAIFKTYPFLEDIVNKLEDSMLYSKVDVNTASYQQLIKIPWIGPVKARRILTYRRERGFFKSLGELTNIRGISRKNLRQIEQFFKKLP